MRLSILDDGHSRVQKFLLSLLRGYLEVIPGPILTMSYRPALFGAAFERCLQEAMRECTHFDKHDCELMSAFVSYQNQCTF